jgi:hypothetical protein
MLRAEQIGYPHHITVKVQSSQPFNVHLIDQALHGTKGRGQRDIREDGLVSIEPISHTLGYH